MLEIPGKNFPSIDDRQRRSRSQYGKDQRQCAAPVMLICWRRKVSLIGPGLAGKLPEWIRPQNTENSNE